MLDKTRVGVRKRRKEPERQPHQYGAYIEENWDAKLNTIYPLL